MHDQIVEEIAPFLTQSEISFYYKRARLRVPLPEGFGEIEIGNLDDSNDDIVGLVDTMWHTHGDVLMLEEGGLSRANAIHCFLTRLFNGEFSLVEEYSGDALVDRTIVDDIESLRKYVPEDRHIVKRFGVECFARLILVRHFDTNLFNSSR
ncbi:MAG: hypothetical protein OER96_00250 [Gammaproteobacteria bacterium]|nr:hypothetical protein [Gammaproteobacteria bacterium]